VEQQGANDIVGAANNAFSFAVLRGGIGAGHAKENSVGLEEGASGEVIELVAVVALYALNGDTELGTDVSKKIG
jgi:hypothetical protein